MEMCFIMEEKRILDKMHRQKVAEVEKLIQTVCEFEEAVLAGGAAANAVRDYQRKVQEMNEEKKVLDRELARAKVTANRVATVVANKWKDANDKVMPVKQWLEERNFFQFPYNTIVPSLAHYGMDVEAKATLQDSNGRQPSTGKDVEPGTFVDMRHDTHIWEAYDAKAQTYVTAIEAARLVLKLHDILNGYKPEEEEDADSEQTER